VVRSLPKRALVSLPGHLRPGTWTNSALSSSISFCGMGLAVSVSGLRKDSDPSRRSAEWISKFQSGEVLALLGPNGAGKTTIVEILEGYQTASAGNVGVPRARIPGTTAAHARTRRDSPAGNGRGAVSDDPRGAQTAGVLLPAPARSRRGDRSRRASATRPVRGSGPCRAVCSAVGLGLALIGDPELLFLDEADDRIRPERAPGGVGYRPYPHRRKAAPSFSRRTTWTRRKFSRIVSR